VIGGDWIAWKDDDLVMIGMSLAELAGILERRYDVQISFTEEKLKEIQYNGALHLTGNIIDMLNNLEQTGNIHFAAKDKKIMILPANGK
jgi:ferric-dicitrate binding protein FerR (iron transport regulator)